MRASAILALASLMSNMTEAVKVTAAGSDDIGPVKFYATDDCSGDFEEVNKGPFCTADRWPWCIKAISVEIPVGKTLTVSYKEWDFV